MEELFKGEHAGSVTLWIRVPDDVASVIRATAPAGMIPKEPLHVTIVYYPAGGIVVHRMVRTLYKALAGRSRMTASLTGVAHFHGPGVLVRLVSIPGIEMIRAVAVAAVPPDSIQYGLIPHVTLGQIEDNVLEPEPLDLSWVVTELELVSDDRVLARIPLT